MVLLIAGDCARCVVGLVLMLLLDGDEPVLILRRPSFELLGGSSIAVSGGGGEPELPNMRFKRPPP